MKRRQLALLLPVALVATAFTLGAQQPPQNLHRVGDHWTAWDPPTAFPEGAEVYTIVPGDTLWALASQFYGDPYLWPQLWERNQYILDAHWIYPGDPLVVSVEVVPLEDLGEVDLGEGDDLAVAEEPVGEEDELALDRSLPAPVPLGSEDDIYCSGYIGPVDEEFGYHLVGSEYSALSPVLVGTGRVEGIYGELDTVKLNLSVGDIVYLDGGRAAGLSPGELYTAVEPQEVVENPLTGDVVGRQYGYQGRLRVLTVQPDTAIAEVVHACAPIRVGVGLKPFLPEPIPLGRITGLRPANVPVAEEALAEAPIILEAEDEVVSLGADHVVYVDRGLDDGVAPGDFFTIYRLNRRGLPPVVLGELAILSVHGSTSLAKIVESRYAIYVGDRLFAK